MRREGLGPVGRRVGRAWRELVREGAEEARRRHRVAPVAGSAGAGGRVARRTVPDVGRATSDQAPWPEAARAGEEAEAGLGPAGGCRTWAWRDAWDATSGLSAATRSPPPAGPAHRTSPAGARCRTTCWWRASWPARAGRSRRGSATSPGRRTWRGRQTCPDASRQGRGPRPCSGSPATMRPAPAPTGTGAPTGACPSSRPAARRPTRPPTPGRSRAGTARRATAATGRRWARPGRPAW